MQRDWVARIFSNKTDNTRLCLIIVQFSKPCDVSQNLIHVSKKILQKLNKEPHDKELKQIESHLKNFRIRHNPDPFRPSQFFVIGKKNVTVTLHARAYLMARFEAAINEKEKIDIVKEEFTKIAITR